MPGLEKIILTPDGRAYVASGSWNLLGGVAVTMVPGARIELATPAFSGRRSTNELPRQLNFSSLVSTSNAVKFRQIFFQFLCSGRLLRCEFCIPGAFAGWALLIFCA